jgi:hypothetical protein
MLNKPFNFGNDGIEVDDRDDDRIGQRRSGRLSYSFLRLPQRSVRRVVLYQMNLLESANIEKVLDKLKLQ